jgi:hypothetical protein
MNWRTIQILCGGLTVAIAGCGYNPYPTPKPVRTPGIDSPFVVQRANHEAELSKGQVALLTAPMPMSRVERPLSAPIKPFEQWSEQEAAADALGRIGAQAIPYLQQALRSPDPEMKKQAAEVLARMGSDAKPAVNDLIVLLDDPDLEVRKVAVRTLGRIGPDAAAAIPALMRTLVEDHPVPPPIAPPAPLPPVETLPPAQQPRMLPQN